MWRPEETGGSAASAPRSGAASRAPQGNPGPSILHVDLDAFYASVEQLDDPSLRGRPVIVGGLGNRGVVSAASYEARRYGVHSAMPAARARRACPDGVFLPPRFDRYAEKSEEVMAILRSITPEVEQLSVDEAFLDARGVQRRYGSGPQVGELVRSRVRAEAGLAASVGVATTKFLAKLTSDLAKPDGMLVVPPGGELEFLHPLPVTRLWGVGPATHRKLERKGVHTIGDVAALEPDVLVAALGASLGAHLHALAHNDDPRPVVPHRDVKSIGAEETFATDLYTHDDCRRELVRLADRVARRLRASGVVARTVTLKVRFADFDTRTRARTVREPTDSSAVLLDVAGDLLRAFNPARGIRLLGIAGSGLEQVTAVQGVLALDEGTADERAHAERRRAVERVADSVRDRFGERAVRPAALLDDDRP